MSRQHLSEGINDCMENGEEDSAIAKMCFTKAVTVKNNCKKSDFTPCK